MSAASTPPAFSLTRPFADAARRVAGHPLGVTATFLLGALPLLAVVAGADWVMRSGAAATLEDLAVGVDAGTPGALLGEPPAADAAREIALLSGLAVAAIALLAAAGAAAAHSGGRLGRGLAAWPVFAAGFTAEICLLASSAAAAAGASWAAGLVHFALADVVAVAGGVLIAWLAARLALWPVLAGRLRLGPSSAARASWRLTRGHALRIAWAAGALAAVLGVPALLLQQLLQLGLGALERAELIAWSPLAIDVVALVPWAGALLAGVLLWSIAAQGLTEAIQRAADPAPGG